MGDGRGIPALSASNACQRHPSALDFCHTNRQQATFAAGGIPGITVLQGGDKEESRLLPKETRKMEGKGLQLDVVCRQQSGEEDYRTTTECRLDPYEVQQGLAVGLSGDMGEFRGLVGKDGPKGKWTEGGRQACMDRGREKRKTNKAEKKKEQQRICGWPAHLEVGRKACCLCLQ
eukprot:g46669.t1